MAPYVDDAGRAPMLDGGPSRALNMKRPTSRAAKPAPLAKGAQPSRRHRGVNLKRIKRPAPDHDLKTALEGFESRIEARAENRERIKSLRNWVDAAPVNGRIKKAKLPVDDAR